MTVNSSAAWYRQTHAYYHITPKMRQAYKNTHTARWCINIRNIPRYIHSRAHTSYSFPFNGLLSSSVHTFVCAAREFVRQVTRHCRKLQEICKFLVNFTTFMRCRSLMLTFYAFIIVGVVVVVNNKHGHIKWQDWEKHLFSKAVRTTTTLSLNVLYL